MISLDREYTKLSAKLSNPHFFDAEFSLKWEKRKSHDELFLFQPIFAGHLPYRGQTPSPSLIYVSIIFTAHYAVVINTSI